jgi:hypothetical protein
VPDHGEERLKVRAVICGRNKMKILVAPFSGWLMIACASGGFAAPAMPPTITPGNSERQGDEQPKPRYVDWVDWSDKFAERGGTEKERALRRYIVKQEGIEKLGSIRYLPEREERLVSEREKAIPILLELLEIIPEKAVFGDRQRLAVPVQDLERLARRAPDAFTGEHLELIHRLIKDKGLHDGDQRLLPLVAILRRKESIPHLVWLLEQPNRSHMGAIDAFQEIAHPDAIPHLKAYAERNPTEAHWANPAIERIQIDNLPMNERVQKWEAIASELASEEAFKLERIQATFGQASWVLSRLAEHGEWRHAELVLKMQEAARRAKQYSNVYAWAEDAYRRLVQKLPVGKRLSLWEDILKEVTDEAVYEAGDDRYVWAIEKIVDEGGIKYLGFLEELARKKNLIEGTYTHRLRWEIKKAITKLKAKR